MEDSRPQLTPYRALIQLFRENEIPMSDRNSFLWALIEDGLALGSQPMKDSPAPTESEDK